jgi:hypothetical protein
VIIITKALSVKCQIYNCRANGAKLEKKSLKVDREKFEGIVKSLLQAKPVKREDVKVSKRKPEKLIPPPAR